MIDSATAVAQIRSGKISPIYLIYGDEPLLMEEVIAELKKSLLPDPSMESVLLFKYDADLDDPERGLTEMRAGAFFGGTKLCVVKNLTTAAKKEMSPWVTALTAYVRDYNPSSVVAVLTRDDPPAQNPLRLSCESSGTVVKCSRLRGRQISKWVAEYVRSRGKCLSSSAAWALEALSVPSLGVLKNEVDKVVEYVGERKTIESSDVAAVCQDASEARVFAVIDAITAGKPRVAMTALERVLASGEQPALVLYLIAQNMRQIARAKFVRSQGASQQDVARSLGLHPFVAAKVYAACPRISEQCVETIYELIMAADEAQKGGYDPVLTLQTLLVELSALFQERRQAK